MTWLKRQLLVYIQLSISFLPDRNPVSGLSIGTRRLPDFGCSGVFAQGRANLFVFSGANNAFP